MRVACIAFAAGAWWLQQQAVLPSRTMELAIALTAVGAIAAKRRRHPVFVRSLLVAIASCACGFGWAAWRADQRIADSLPRALENRDVVVVGTVAALPSLADRGVRFAFDVERVETRDEHGAPLRVPTRLALGWYAPRANDGSSPTSTPRIEPGQRWRLVVRLKRPHGAANPDGFDYEYWLLEENLRATGYVRPGVDEASDDVDRGDAPVARGTRRLDDFVWTFGHVVERVRARLRDRIVEQLARGRPLAESAPYAGVIVALVIGDQRAIAQSDWIVFNRTGIGHLVSISGLHVSMLAALGAWLVFTLWRRRPAWSARLPAQKAAALAGTAVAFVYCLLAGFGVPAQRTLYMIAVVAFALWTGRTTPASRVLAIALGVVIAIDPWSVTGAGFWLSFTAVAAIFYVSAGRIDTASSSDTRSTRVWRSIRGALRVQWAVTLALTPLTLLLFYQVSIVSPLANAIAIPLVSFVVTPLALAGAVLPTPLAGWVLWLAHASMAGLAAWLGWLSRFGFAVWAGPAPGPVAFVAAMIGVAWSLAPHGIPSRWLGAFWMTPLFAWPVAAPAPGTARIVALDIGQGTAVVIETATHRLLYDTGPRYAPDNDAGLRTIVPYLRARGIGHLDAMIVSHNDSDHSGGALSVLRSLPVARVTSSLAATSAIVRESSHHVPCIDGQRWSHDGVDFAMLHPLGEGYAVDGIKPNAKSCVLRITAGNHAMLLTGDIEKPQELELVARHAADLRADVLLVPHHGSRTSSSDSFLDAIGPESAIAQAGYLNRFGHPRPDVLARYDAHRIGVLRTDRDGAVTVVLRDAGVELSRYREIHRRYWYDR